MSGLRRASYTSQNRRRPTLEFEQRSALDRVLFSLFELSSPSSERCSGSPQTQFKPGSTAPLMKNMLASLLLKPVSLLLLIALVLSLGFALHLAGPISIQTHRVELPDVEIHIGGNEALKSANPSQKRLIPRKLNQSVDSREAHIRVSTPAIEAMQSTPTLPCRRIRVPAR